jgi:hypothetical protein
MSFSRWLSLVPALLTVLMVNFVNAQSAPKTWVEDVDGDPKPFEYRLIDPKGAVTRGECPYTCADRQIPKEHCKEWKSITNSPGGECYVQDLRISNDDAMPKDTKLEAKKTTDNYKH